MKKDLLFLPVLLLLIIIYGTSGVRCSFQDQEMAINNNFSAWNDSLWVQTTQADFNGGVATQVTITSPGNVTISTSPGGFAPVPGSFNGSLASQVLNAGVANATWDALFWSEALPAYTNITFFVRANNSLFLKNNTVITWIPVGASSPVKTGLPRGQYMQWRANLTTTNKTVTPDLQEVRVWYH